MKQNEKEIKISKGEWFGVVVPTFQNKTIYNKWITGIGGTTLAIQEGNCIVISPNVTGITSKENQANVIAVYQGVTPDSIERQYNEIQKRGLKPAIISTPDSFFKIFEVFGNSVYSRFKCIVDEIHCFQEASGFRDSLAEFIEEYFDLFDYKVVLTATYIPISHRLFKDWQYARINPDYEYFHEISIFRTYGYLYGSVQHYVSTLPEHEKKLIFLNSLEGMKCLDKLGFKFETLCSKDSQTRAINYRKYDGNLGDVSIATSAYYQACDLHENAHIIFVVDAEKLSHTILTCNQIIQAIGRCRKGVLSVTIFLHADQKKKTYLDSYEEGVLYVRDLAHIALGQAQIMLKDLHKQMIDPPVNQINGISETSKSQTFGRKLLYYDKKNEAFKIHWLNVDGEAQERFASQHYTSDYMLAKYLSMDPRIKVIKTGMYDYSNAIRDCDLYDKEMDNEAQLKLVITMYTELGIKEGKGYLAWNSYMTAESTSSKIRELMELCQRAGKLNMLENLAKTKGKKQSLDKFKIKISGMESFSSNVQLRQEIRSIFGKRFYKSSSIKEKLKRIYRKYQIKRTAKASDIKFFLEVEGGKEQVKREGDETVKGYAVLLCAVK